jgi:hypothetical protein
LRHLVEVVVRLKWYLKTKMSKEEFARLSLEWYNSGVWKLTSLDLDLKTWLEMQGYKLSQEEFNELNTKEK